MSLSCLRGFMPYKDPAQQRAFQNQWAKNRRLVWLAQQGPCVSCGSIDSLEVDHRYRSSKVTHRVWTLTAKKRAAELAKCQPLCRPCHKAKTISETTRHGASQYRKGCRCGVCRTNKQQQMARYRARKRVSA